MDLKLSAVQATLGRAGTSLMLVVAMCVVLVASDSVILSYAPALQRVTVSGDPIMLPDPNDHEFPHGVAHGIIPLGRTRINVPILMYHYIQYLPANIDRLTFNLSVTPASFKLQMDWLQAHGYHSVTFDDLRAYFLSRAPLPSKPFVITLDDGYRDLYTTAYPIIKGHGFKAVAYIVTNFVGHTRYVTMSMILQMMKDGFEIGGHTVDHANLSRMSLPSITYEVVASKQWLEQQIGRPVVDFAYPSGKYNDLVVAELGVAGYSTAVTEADGSYHEWATRYAWPRTRVGGGEGIVDFIKSLGPVEPYLIVAPPSP
jgi:peptidoglycan/xylan/chitin deacetylase (PgdA/CDA1 family)